MESIKHEQAAAAYHVAEQSIQQHEGLRLKPYYCTEGKLSIGYGRNLDDVGITEAEACVLLKQDIATAIRTARHVCPVFEKLTPVRQAVLIDMAFNMGLKRLSGFKKMLQCIDINDYDGAAKEMLESLWARQVKGRAVTLAQRMREGL